MDFLISNFSNIGNAIGWTLIHFLWQGTILFLSYWIITRIFLKGKINFQYWIGITFIALCLIIPAREFIIQLDSGKSDIIHQIGMSIDAIESIGILSPTEIFISLMQKFIPYLVIFWTISVFLISFNLIKSWFSLVRLGKETSLELPDNLLKKLKQAMGKLKLKFKPIVILSNKINIPATFGYFKPVILLPVSLIAKLPSEQMEAVLLHELCHIKRADFLHNIMQLLVETLFFYHPLTKWISRDIRKIREQCCDELVLELKTDPLVYAKALTNIASIYNNNKSNTASYLQIAVNDGELFNRIKSLMLNERSKSPLTTISLAILFLVLALVVLNTIFKTKNHQNSLLFETDSLVKKENNLQQQEIRPTYLTPNVYQLINQQQQQKPTHNSTNNNANIAEPKLTDSKVKQSVESTNTLNNTFITNENKLTNDIHVSNAKTNDEKSQINDLTITEEIKAQNTLVQEVKPPILETGINNNYPRIIKRVNPVYRRIARSRGIEGTVILSFSINSNGRVKKITVDKSSPLKLLDGNAKQALRQWRFDPKSINEYNIKNRYQQIFSFNLNETNNCTDGNIGTRLTTNQVCQEL